MDKCGKLYQDIFLKEFRWFPTGNLADDYYAKVKTITEKGYRQIIFTSSIMLALIEHFLLSHNSCIVDIEFTKEDEELSVVKGLIGMTKTNKAYWNVLKEKLELLSKHDIDIKRVEIKMMDGGIEYLMSIQVDGIVTVTDGNVYHTVTNEIVKVVERIL